jgi:plastocyanin
MCYRNGGDLIMLKKLMQDRILTVSLLMVALLIIFTGCPRPAPTPGPTPTPTPNQQAVETNSISMRDFEFEPSVIRVEPGTTVTWTNQGENAHTVVSLASDEYEEGELFNSGMIQPGQTFTHTFQEAGEYQYYCDLHPQMRGRVMVQQ